MRPPWLVHSSQEAELETLQTDIMRFMAILGFCLAAIFSLVQGAALEQGAVPPLAGEQPIAGQSPPAHKDIAGSPPRPEVLRPAPAKPAITAVQAAQQSASTVKQSEPVAGFTLEFSSVQSLDTLVQQGQVQLVARRGDQFWWLDADGRAVPGEAPAAYYQMHTDTVPGRLRRALPAGARDPATRWGVILPARTIDQIRQLTTASAGGQLLIGPDGTVVLEDPVANSTVGGRVNRNSHPVRDRGGLK